MRRRITLHNKTFDYGVRKSKRARRLRVAVYCDSSVMVTTPYDFGMSKIEHFLRLKGTWILDKITYFKNLSKTIKLPTGKRAYNKYRVHALELVNKKVAELNKFYNFSFNNIIIKNHKTRWGSCSKKKNLNFNYRIVFLPEFLAEYIIVHELCHLGSFDHSRKFWTLVEKTVPDFRARNKQLKALVGA